LVSWGLSRHVLKWYIGNVYVCSRRKRANKEDHYEHPLPRIPTDRAEHEYGEISELQTRKPTTQPEGFVTLNIHKHCRWCWQILKFEIIVYINIYRHFVILKSNVFWSYFHGYVPLHITYITKHQQANALTGTPIAVTTTCPRRRWNHKRQSKVLPETVLLLNYYKTNRLV